MDVLIVAIPVKVDLRKSKNNGIGDIHDLIETTGIGLCRDQYMCIIREEFSKERTIGDNRFSIYFNKYITGIELTRIRSQVSEYLQIDREKTGGSGYNIIVKGGTGQSCTL